MHCSVIIICVCSRMWSMLNDIFDSVPDRPVNTNKPPAHGIVPKKSPAAPRCRPDTRNAASGAATQKPGFRSRGVPSAKMQRLGMLCALDLLKYHGSIMLCWHWYNVVLYMLGMYCMQHYGCSLSDILSCNKFNNIMLSSVDKLASEVCLKKKHPGHF